MVINGDNGILKSPPTRKEPAMTIPFPRQYEDFPIHPCMISPGSGGTHLSASVPGCGGGLRLARAPGCGNTGT